MKHRLALLLISFLLALPVHADLQKLVNETQKMDLNGNNMKMIWWIPNEYWIESFKGNPNMTEASINEFIGLVSNYTIVAVIDAQIGQFGDIKAKQYDELVGELLLDIDRSTYRPIDKAELSADIVNFFGMMKPLMAGMLGQFGNGIEFFAFKGDNNERERLIDPLKEKKFSITLGKTYQYRLPLGSLLPNKIDPKTKEEFPGNYQFSPFTGNKLR